jgi:WD40 repeat protein
VIFLALLSLAFVTQGQTSMPKELVLQTNHTGFIRALAISPDSQFAASGGQDQTIKIWSITDARLWRTIEGTPGFIEALAYSSDGKFLASGSDGVITLFEVKTGAKIRTIMACDEVLKETRIYSDFSSMSPSAVSSIAFQPGSMYVASACDADKSVKVWDAATGKRISTFLLEADASGPSRQEFGRPVANATAGIDAVTFDASGQLLAAAGHDRTIQIWDTSNGKNLTALKGHSGSILSLVFSPDSRFLTSSSTQDKSVRLWDVMSGTLLRTLPGNWAWFDSKARWFTASDEGKVTVWNAETGKVTARFTTVPQYLARAVSSNGQWVMTVGDRSLVVMDTVAASSRELPDTNVSTARPVVSRDGRWIALRPYFANDVKTTLKLFNLMTGKIQSLPGPGASSSIFSGDSRILAASADDKLVRLFEVSSGSALKEFTDFKKSGGSIARIAITSDGRRLAAAGYDGRVCIWDVDSGNLLRSVIKAGFQTLDFSPDGHWIAVSTYPDITISAVDTGQELHRFKGYPPAIFSPDGRAIAMNGENGRISIWDIASGREIQTLMGDSEGAISIAFSPDDHWLLTQGRNENVTLWDLRTSQKSRSFVGDSMGFAAAGRLLWTTGKDGITRFWNTNEGTLATSLVVLENGFDWVVVTPDGHFDGSEAGIRKLLSWRIGDRIVPVDEFMALRRAGLLAALVINGSRK